MTKHEFIQDLLFSYLIGCSEILCLLDSLFEILSFEPFFLLVSYLLEEQLVIAD